MTDEQRLNEIRARADAATPGPWRTDGVGVTASRVSGVAVDELVRANALFVSHARDDIPWLLDLVRQQAGVIADLQEESDAARLALRYREALERIAGGGLLPALFGHVASEALEGKP